jgi:hypothetical protein
MWKPKFPLQSAKDPNPDHGEESDSETPTPAAADSEDDSFTSSIANSAMIEAEVRQRVINSFCAKQALYISNTVPTGFTLRGIFAEGAGSSRQHQTAQDPIFYKPIIIVSSLLATPDENANVIGLEIVPWKPTNDAIALQLFATLVEHQATVNQQAEKQKQQQSSQDSGVTSNPTLEFETSETQPSPATLGNSSALRPKRIEFESQNEENRPSPELAMGQMQHFSTGQKTKGMALPNIISVNDARTPLT